MTFKYNKDSKLRDSMLPNPHFNYGGDASDYSLFSFDNLGAVKLGALIKLGFADPEECQNDSPTIGDILKFLKANPSCTAHGYAVSPERDDYRISVEGVEGHTGDEQQISAFTKMFRDADDFRAQFGYQYAWYD